MPRRLRMRRQIHALLDVESGPRPRFSTAKETLKEP
jgi:hypothetical protein